MWNIISAAYSSVMDYLYWLADWWLSPRRGTSDCYSYLPLGHHLATAVEPVKRNPVQHILTMQIEGETHVFAYSMAMADEMKKEVGRKAAKGEITWVTSAAVCDAIRLSQWEHGTATTACNDARDGI